MKRILILFGAGCLGALANSLALWQLGELGVTKFLDVPIAPVLTPDWLYPRIVWGGIWGLIFFLPLFNANPLVKGTLLSIFPTIVQLFIIFPFMANKGIAGMDLGTFTPVVVIFANWVWGVVTAFILKYSK